MKKQTEPHELLADIIAEGGSEDFRAVTLEHGLAEMRRTRARRRARRMTAMLAVPLIFTAALLFVQDRGVETPMTSLPPLQAPAAKTVEGTPIRILTDDELLDLFKERPVALLGPRGNQRLVLLDERAN